MKYKNLIVGAEGPITVITLNRPDKLNAIDADMLSSLDKALTAIASDKKCRAVIITGAGGRAFCSGADIDYLGSLKTEKDASSFVKRVHQIFDKIEDLEKPVIAAVGGFCFGGGCELAMACDMRIATPESKFGQPEVKLGIIPGGGGTYRLPSLVGTSRAKELILVGDFIGAGDAFRIGLINRVVETHSLMREAKAIAARINLNSYNAVKNAKRAINANLKRNGDPEKTAFVSSFKHADRKEGLKAFREHRRPKFQ